MILDAETPNGVNKWFELPIFQRIIKRVGASFFK
jgi:hypothetical protein